MNTYHSPHHWIPVAIVLMIALLTLSNAFGQRNDASAMFEGRPALAGAQAGTGAMAGPPQGGIGVQGQDDAQIALRKRSTGVADMPQGKVVPNTDAIAENRAVRDNRDIVPRDRDSGMAKDRRSVAQRAKDAVRRIVQRSRHGVSDGDIRTAGQ